MNKREFIKSALLIPALYITNASPQSKKDSQSQVSNKDNTCRDSDLNILQWKNLVKNNDWTPAFDAASEHAKQLGGARIRIPAGRYNTRLTLSSYCYWYGDGQGLTVLSQEKNNNRDIVITENFSILTGKGPLSSAPISFGLSDVTIDGNYLENYEITIQDGDTSVNNNKGSGLKIFGSKYNIDVEIVNCPEIGFYSEAVNYENYPYEQDSRIRITGRVFGKEGVIFRGPADINIEHVVMGCVGWLATQAEREAKLVMSDLYPEEPVHVMVSDESTSSGSHFNGHHEFEFMHLYGNRHGYGYRTVNTSRIKGAHLVCENCRGGAFFSERVWGAILILECHNNSRLSSGITDAFPDVTVLSRQSLDLNVIIRRTTTEAKKYIGLHSKAEMLNLRLSYFSIEPIPDNSIVAVIDSKNSNYSLMLRDVLNTAVLLRGYNNIVTINGSRVKGGSLVEVNVNGAKGTNKLEIMAEDCDQVITVKDADTVLDLNINADLRDGQKVFGNNNLYQGSYTSKLHDKSKD